MNIDIIYQLALDRLNEQIKRIDGIDSKIGITFGLANGVVIGLVSFASRMTNTTSCAVSIFIALTVGFYLATLVQLYFAYRWGKWVFNPDMKTLKDICYDSKYQQYPEVVKQWVVNECLDSLERNKTPLSKKVNLANKALIALSLQCISLAIAFLFYIFS